VRMPLSLVLSPLLHRGERKKRRTCHVARPRSPRTWSKSILKTGGTRLAAGCGIHTEWVPRLAQFRRNYHFRKECLDPPMEHVGVSPICPTIYVPPPGHTSLRDRYARRLTRVSASLVAFACASAHCFLAPSISSKFNTQAFEAVCARIRRTPRIPAAKTTAIAARSIRNNAFGILFRSRWPIPLLCAFVPGPN
jgi:hypothetical protein